MTYVLDPAARVLLFDLGVSAATVLRRASLPADLFSRTPIAMTADEYYRLWTALAEEHGGDTLPIAIARALRVEVFQPPIFAALCSPNLAVAARRIATHKRLVGPLRLDVDESRGGLALTPVWPDDPPAVLVTWELVFWVALARIATRADVRPTRVTAPEPPTDRAAYRDYLGVPIDVGDAATITFSPLDAARPFLTANNAMWRFFEPELRRRLSELDDQATTSARVKAALLELLPAGETSMGAVARQLAVSGRTLQRRLRAEGATFQGVLNATRESLARRYLADSAMSAAEIAFLLGYEGHELLLPRVPGLDRPDPATRADRFGGIAPGARRRVDVGKWILRRCGRYSNHNASRSTSQAGGVGPAAPSKHATLVTTLGGLFTGLGACLAVLASQARRAAWGFRWCLPGVRPLRLQQGGKPWMQQPSSGSSSRRWC